VEKKKGKELAKGEKYLQQAAKFGGIHLTIQTMEMNPLRGRELKRKKGGGRTGGRIGLNNKKLVWREREFKTSTIMVERLGSEDNQKFSSKKGIPTQTADPIAKRRKQDSR